MNKRLALLLLLAVASPLAPGAEQHGLFTAKNVIGVGAAYQTADATLRASVGDLPDVSVDLDDLGVDDEDWSWALEWRWRFKPKWMLVALAYQFDQDGGRSVQRDFNFDGKEFQAGAAVDTEMSLNTYILDVMYSVYQSEKAEVFVGGGIHAIDLEASISGRAFVGDLERQRSTGSSEILAPLPNLRAQGFYSFNKRWGASLSMGWLSANYDDYDGGFLYIHPRVAYMLGESWAITAGYQFVDIDLEHQKSGGREAEFDLNFQGPTLMLNYRF